MNTLSTPPLPTRSTFVSVLAWIFIVLSGFSVFIGFLQNIMIQFMFHGHEVDELMLAFE